MNKTSDKPINIVVPIAGRGGAFKQAGYTFPKPLIDVRGKTMIELVINNLRPAVPHRFVFIALREQCEKYDMYNVLKRAAGNDFDLVELRGATEGAACTVLTAIEYVNNDHELIIANSDQIVDGGIDGFIHAARTAEGKSADGMIMTFPSSHPRWSYVRTDAAGKAVEIAEKKVISPDATAGIYYFKKGSDFIRAAQSMIRKNIRHDNEFYVCPVYNELIIEKKNIAVYPITAEKMHGLGTPEDLNAFLKKKKQ